MTSASRLRPASINKPEERLRAYQIDLIELRRSIKYIMRSGIFGDARACGPPEGVRQAGHRAGDGDAAPSGAPARSLAAPICLGRERAGTLGHVADGSVPQVGQEGNPGLALGVVDDRALSVAQVPREQR